MQLGTGDLYCTGKSGPGDEGDYFGCRHVRGVSRTANEDGNSWIRCGTLSQKHDSFRVDKKAMLKVLKTQTKGEACLLCPAFDWRRVRAEVNELPAVIKLGEQSPFEVRYSRIDPAKALGIKAKESVRATKALGSRSMAVLPGEKISNLLSATYQASATAMWPARKLPWKRSRAWWNCRSGTPLTSKRLAQRRDRRTSLRAPGQRQDSAGQGRGHREQCPPGNHQRPGSAVAVARPERREPPRRLRAARCWAPSIVLIDELDSLAPRRALLSQHHDVQILSQLLVLLDGLEARGRVVVIGTTNRLEALDPAICRPGRFDYHIEVASPDRRGRRSHPARPSGQAQDQASLRTRRSDRQDTRLLGCGAGGLMPGSGDTGHPARHRPGPVSSAAGGDPARCARGFAEFAGQAGPGTHCHSGAARIADNCLDLLCHAR